MENSSLTRMQSLQHAGSAIGSLASIKRPADKIDVILWLKDITLV